MSIIVYVLRDSNEKLYKGLTSDLDRRLKEHKRGHTQTTKRMRDLEVVYIEKYDSFEDTRARELYFKTAAGRRF